MNQHVNRRALVSAGSSAAMVPALATLMTVHAESAAAVAENEDTPILALFREWVAYENWLNNETKGMPEDEFNALVDKSCRMAERIGEIDITCARDFAAKYLALNTLGGGTLISEVYDWDATLADDAAQALGTTIETLRGQAPRKPDVTEGGGAEIIRLGIEFDRAAGAYMAVEPRRHQTYKVWRAEAERLGLWQEGSQNPAHEALMVSTGYRAASDENNALTRELIALHDKIIALPATTIHAVAVKTTAVAWDAGDYGFPESGEDATENDGVWGIVHELRALAGLPSVAELADRGEA